MQPAAAPARNSAAFPTADTSPAGEAAFRDEGGLSEEKGCNLVLGMRHGRGRTDGVSARERTSAATQRLMDHFCQKHGAIVCRTLLNGCDLTTEEGQEYFTENDLLAAVCVPCVQTTVMFLEKDLEAAESASSPTRVPGEPEEKR